jgi:DnaJ family protein C protein 28
MAQWESAIEQQIREAQERGAFDRLPGLGQPLPREDWDGDWGLAYHVLRQAGETLPWITLGREIETAQEKLRVRLEEARLLPRTSVTWRTERERLRKRYLEEAAALDKLLEDYAFTVPVRHLERGRLPQHVAARQFDAACPT